MSPTAASPWPRRASREGPSPDTATETVVDKGCLIGGPAYTSLAGIADAFSTPQPEASHLAGARTIVIQDLCPGRPIDHLSLGYVLGPRVPSEPALAPYAVHP
jgi:hypothetical protein